MEIHKQHIVLNLIRSKRYVLDPLTGGIISNIGKEPRILKPNIHYSGYLQYCLDIGFNTSIQVYGQGFTYLATWLHTYDPAFVIDHIDRDKANNKPDNLRCITEKENTRHDYYRGSKPGGRKVRIPIDQRHEIRKLALIGVSYCKLAKQFNTTRQTVSAICNEVK